jgi:hypothetical protein
MWEPRRLTAIWASTACYRDIFTFYCGTEAGFLRVLRFPLPILIPPTAPYSSIIRGWSNRPNSGRRTKWTQSNPTPRNQKTFDLKLLNIIKLSPLNRYSFYKLTVAQLDKKYLSFYGDRICITVLTRSCC